MTQYAKAPLPFIGQKRNFLKHFKDVLNRHIPDDGADWTIVDAFGGSGLLAHTAKRCKPAARVVYNDYDGYAERLRHIPDTNRLRRHLAGLLAGLPRDMRLDAARKQSIIEAVCIFDGYRDVKSVSSWLLFSGNQAAGLDDLRRKTFYNALPRGDYPAADAYLDGLEIVSQPFQELLPPFLDRPRTLLVLDPPYVSTTQAMYANPKYFGMVEFLRLMEMVRPPFVFFSSTKSELPAYLDFVRECRPHEWRRFEGLEKRIVKAPVSVSHRYEDNMIYKF